ncbi:MAG TPA: helix-turn-helix domain-containing protein [Pirellulales bacterium]
MVDKAPLQPMLSAEEVAAHLGVTIGFVRSYIAAGTLVAVNVGRGKVPRWRIDLQDLEAFKVARRAVRDVQSAKSKFRRPAGLPRYT